MEQNSPDLSSQEFGSEFGQLFSLRKNLLDTQAEEMARFLEFDSPEFNNRLWWQAYHELYFDNPAKRLLWQAEVEVRDFASDENKGRRERFFHPECLLPLVVESYGVVAPSEGYRLLSSMPDDAIKVEALARFSSIDPIFAHEARKLVVTLDDWQFRSKLDIACFARDDEMLTIIFTEVIAKYSKEDSSNWDYIDRLINLASLGHKPALTLAKQEIPRLKVVAEYDGDHWLEEAALLAYIDELVQRGQIPVRVTTRLEDNDSTHAIESTWQDFLMQHKEAVQKQLADGVSLPVFGTLNRFLDTNTSYFAQGTRFYDELRPADYIDSKVEEFAVVLGAQGEDVLPRLWQKDVDAVDKKYGYSKKEVERKFNSVSLRDRIDISMITGRKWTLEDEITGHSRDLNQVVRFMNRIALIKAMAVAAPQLI